MQRRWTSLAVVLIFVLAAFLRFDFLASANHHNSHDTVNYDIMVRQWLEKGVYAYKSEEPNAQVSPGFPLFMAASYLTADYINQDPMTLIRYLQACFSLVTLWLIYRIAKRLGGEKAALPALAVAAIYPPFIWTNGAVLTESLATLLFMSYVYLQLLAFDKHSRWLTLSAGIAMGLTVLTRPEFLVVLPASFVLYLLWHRKAKQTIKLLFFAGIGTAIVLAPWLIRNLISLHEPVIASTQVNPFAAGTYPDKNYDDGLVDRTGKTQMEVAKERLKIGFTKHTGTFLKWYTIGKLQHIYGKMFTGSGHQPPYPVIPFKSYLHLMIIFLSIVSSVVLLCRWRNPASLLVVIVLTISVTRLAFVPEYRYNVTAMPLLIIMDSLLVVLVLGWIERRFKLGEQLKLIRRRSA
ncbi:ArnT family glycosyltransferase [Cohnella silvisoli]|uniref:Glycosyltransferase family 39 protein n=1 Tax=Cohnella silvisoli TaxID=2873699 RepID=A0ABV1KUQ7_9BACL|nr:glycosyltransferase family 39 protein [Cohnella silvisoli]MCD9022989.1 glycosyltransferase family 39 protein [Cohnella silvisoli]